MILVDSSVWIDHLRAADPVLTARLEAAEICCHPFVVGELALGSLKARTQVLDLLQQLPASPQASSDEVLYLIDHHRLYSRGIGWVDAHLLASTLLAGDARLWTRDQRLDACAKELGVSMSEKT